MQYQMFQSRMLLRLVVMFMLVTGLACAPRVLSRSPIPPSSSPVTLHVSPNLWTGWATFDIMYFTVKCVWSDGVPDPDCTRQGSVQWSTDYGWFEPLRRGNARTTLTVAPPMQRSPQAVGQTVLWSSDFNTTADASGTIKVTYAGATTQLPVIAHKATKRGRNPLPADYFQYTAFSQGLFAGGYRKLKQWIAENDLRSTDYQQQQLSLARQVSDRLEAYIRDWWAGRASAEIPDILFPKSLSNDKLRWQLVRLEDFNPTEFWTTREARGDIDVFRDGTQILYPDYNATYIRGDYLAPFGSRLVIEGNFPHSRFFDIQNSEPFDPRYPAGIAGGAPEISIVDVDINPDPGHINPFRMGADRTAVNRHYHVYFQQAAGNTIDLNERLNPGSMTEIGVPAYRTLHSSNNTRVAGPLRSGGGSTAGDLLPAQLWLRYYAPDKVAGAFGGVLLPKVHLELPTGEKFMIVPLRAPNPRGIGRDIVIRRINGPYPAFTSATFEPHDTAWTSGKGWLKQFGIPRLAMEEAAIAGGPVVKLLLNKPNIRKLDAGAFGRGSDQGSTGSLEAHATACTYINYTSRSLVIGEGSVAVLTGKLPKTPRTRNSEHFMQPGEMRYFSIARYVEAPSRNDPVLNGAAYGTIMDDEFIVPESGLNQGWFMLMFSRAKDRPANAIAQNGVTWRDWGQQTQQSLTVRWMSVQPDWYAPKWAPDSNNLPWENADWAEPIGKWKPTLTFTNDRRKSFMQDHHLVIHYMTKQQFEALGSNLDARSLLHWNDW